MIIDCIADLHGHYPELEGGDLLIVAGDLTARDYEQEYFQFFNWIHEQKYKKKIVIAGNHDVRMQQETYQGPQGVMKDAFIYLCDSGTEFEGLKIWGMPWTLTFEGMNPRCKAFTVDTEWELEEKLKMIPWDVDILITHSPPHGIFDKTIDGHHVGSHGLLYYSRMHQPKLHVSGHIHESYGMKRPNLGFIDLDGYPIYVNASLVNERYEPVNKPIRIKL